MTEETQTDTIENDTNAILGERYLRRRPFLVIYEIMRPGRDENGNPVNTSKAGWKDVPGQLVPFERPLLVDRVSAKQMTEAAFIIDIINRRIVKNRYSSSQYDPEAFLSHYTEKYAEQITEALRIWAHRSALDISTKRATA